MPPASPSRPLSTVDPCHVGLGRSCPARQRRRGLTVCSTVVLVHPGDGLRSLIVSDDPVPANSGKPDFSAVGAQPRSGTPATLRGGASDGDAAADLLERPVRAVALPTALNAEILAVCSPRPDEDVVPRLK